MSVLADIVAATRNDLVHSKVQTPLAHLIAEADRETARRPAINVADQLRGAQLNVIAEVKRRSPSVGHLADIASPSQLALSYQSAGAAMISVLTEPHRFGGSMEDLAEVRGAVTTAVLRKDFIVDEYQVVQARAAGADALLLIVAALTDEELSRLLKATSEWGMTALVEVHEKSEVARANDSGAAVIGVNARNLATLDVDHDAFSRLAPLVGDGKVRVAESGIRTAGDAARARAAGADAVLVGQALVQSEDPGALIQAMRSEGANRD